jgi:hypothetical protein
MENTGYENGEVQLILFVAAMIVIIMGIIVAVMPVAGINYQQ